MSGLKKYDPALRFGQLGTQPPVGAITPDEVDDYCVYNVINPNIGATWVGTRTSGTADVTAVVIRNAILDYPRNLEFAIAGSSVGMAGSVDVDGRDQFGSVISETMGFGSVVFLVIVLIVWNFIFGQFPFTRTIIILTHNQVTPFIFWCLICFILLFIPEKE